MKWALILGLLISLTACSKPSVSSYQAYHQVLLDKHGERPYPQPDTLIGEKLYEHEEEVAYKIADQVLDSIDRVYQQHGMVSRDAHAKAHGCVKAKFHVYQDLSPFLEKGVFSRGQTYDALIRFSNSHENPQGYDWEYDARGMAIKLTNIHQDHPEKRSSSIKERPMSQDFIMINHEFFFLDDPSGHLTFMEALNESNALIRGSKVVYALGFRGLWNAFQIKFQAPISHPFQTQYFSMVPYRLGNHKDPKRIAVKYSARQYQPPKYSDDRQEIAESCVYIQEGSPDDSHPNFLRRRLLDTLKHTLASEKHACMEFLIQPRDEQKADQMSVENTQRKWDQDDAPFYPVALIKIPRQDHNPEENIKECNERSFAPWNALDEHRPLGAVSRIRKVVYPISSEYRNWLIQKKTQEKADTQESLIGQDQAREKAKAQAKKNIP